MSTLVIGKSAFYRVKSGQTGAEVEKTMRIPASGAFAGAILPVEEYVVHRAQPFESYESIAQKYGITSEKLKAVNGGRPLYPSCKVYVPLL